MKIAIIGAGVAGCIVARALSAQPGVEVVCLERVQPDDHSESGTGLNIGPNAIKALRMTDPALADAVAEASLPWKHWRVSLTDGTVLFDLPLSKVASCDGVRIRWSDLYKVLRDAAAPAVRYACEIEAVEAPAEAGGKTRVRYRQGGQRHVLDDIDLLIAADGRYSQVRAAFAGEPAIRHLGVSIFRMLVPDDSGGLIDDYEQWFNGPNRLLSFRVPPGRIYIAGTFPIDPGQPIPDAWKTAAALREAYMPAQGQPSAQAQWLIRTVCGDPGALHWARMQESEVRFSEPDAQVMYLGDSAHGMVPTLGQGATQAIEDACAAACIVLAGIRQGLPPRAWLERLEAERDARIRFVMRFSMEASDTMLAGADPVAGTRKKNEAPFMDALQRLYQDVRMHGLPAA